ncbi:TonB-dependent receptor domain-containing protein [Celeribacter neptunius]|uniref:Hemoglobin/transferrin/lactoferrin receptor protein n=1 Tax=Celeribacter neptunius TaxID=588602 RepID=A0A1I3TK44_9RHOB|nr:TonB-dependent receptor [Celeribacter neptunius]SFJ69887.1 hemoglobin/transferrin/lactoferrin receptor protein [Celeribacter neptunius]
MNTRTQLLAGAAFVAVLPTSLLAQDLLLGTIELGESLRGLQTDTATSETILSQDELDARQAATFAELMDTIPGVTVSNGATPQGSTLNIRGLGSDAGTYGSNTKVSVVVDGVAKGQEELYRQGGTLTMEPELFKEVKVIRGPGESFRFSSGAIGGTVEAVTKDAADFLEDGDTFALRQKLSYQNNGESGASSTILAWAPDDRLDVIAFYGYRDAGEYETGDGVTEADTGYKLSSAMLKASYQATSDLKFTASVSQTKDQLRDVSYDFFGSLFDVRVDADVEDTTAYLAMQYAPLGNDLINSTVKLVYSDELISNLSGTTSSTIYNADNRTERLALIAENEAYFTTGAVDHTLLTGIEIGRRERSSISDTGENAGSTPGGTDDYIAAYVTDEMRFGALTLTPQLRYESQTITGENNGLATDGTDYKADDWAGALAARYEITPEFAIFGTMAYNTNLPIIDDLTNATKIETTEKAVTLEAGLSFDRMDAFAAEDRLQAKLTAFNTRVWNNTTYTNYNSGADQHIELDGVEVELSYAHSAFYADFNAARIRGNWGDGSWFNNAPADSARLSLGKRFLQDQLDLSIEARHDWSTDRNVQFDSSSSKSDSFTVYTLSAAYTPDSGVLKGTEFRASVENVFDETYQPYLSSRTAPGRSLTLSLAKVF